MPSSLALARVEHALNYQQITAHTHQGGVWIFAHCRALQALSQALHRRIVEALDDAYPPTVHLRQSPEQFLPVLDRLQEEAPKWPEMQTYWTQILLECGLETGATGWDFMPLRIVPPHGIAASWEREHVPGHRDTWGSNIPCQLNWWAPIYPIGTSSTIGFWPEYFDQPVDNTTDTWSFAEFLASRKQSAQSGVKASYPTAPQMRGDHCPQLDELTPLVIAQDELMCFSSQHLHASVPNTSGRIRYSIELRTIDFEQARCGEGPRNVDNADETPRLKWFKPLEP